MNKCYHILNGDALGNIFPSSIKGTLYVLRECLCDGELCNDSLSQLYKVRSKFIASLFENFNPSHYYENAVSEFEKMASIDKDSTICLWFEKDVFCQVNFWFALYVLKEQIKTSDIFLVLPLKGHEYSFPTMNGSQLEEAYENKIQLNEKECEAFSKLWTALVENDFESMIKIAKTLPAFPFVLQAVQLQQDKEELKPRVRQLIKELNTHDEKVLYKAFASEFPMYGYGDLQFRRLLNAL